MILEQLANPRIAGAKEDIIKITMTVDQFHMLRDCVSLAWQNAEKDSRMFEITTLIRNDLDQLVEK